MCQGPLWADGPSTLGRVNLGDPEKGERQGKTDRKLERGLSPPSTGVSLLILKIVQVCFEPVLGRVVYVELEDSSRTSSSISLAVLLYCNHILFMRDGPIYAGAVSELYDRIDHSSAHVVARQILPGRVNS